MRILLPTIAATALLMLAACNTPIDHAASKTVHINGNCNMCRKTIEKAGNRQGLAKVSWNKNTRMAVLEFDSTKTTAEEILRRIADAGYDNAAFRATDETYETLHKCCKYDRTSKPSVD